MLPWLAFIPLAIPKGGKLSDIEYLSIKAFEGKLRKAEGNLSATGDLATLTAAAGKDMYIARAKVVFYANVANSAAIGDEVVLKINGVVVETAKYSFDASTAGAGGVLSFPYTFKNIGHKVTPSQVIKLEVITLDSQTDVEGFIECNEEPTGVSPQIPAI